MDKKRSGIGTALLLLHTAAALAFCVAALLIKGFAVALPGTLRRGLFALPLVLLAVVLVFLLGFAKRVRFNRTVFLLWQTAGVLWWLAVLWVTVGN